MFIFPIVVYFQSLLRRRGLHTCSKQNLRRPLSAIPPNTPLCVLPGRCINSSFRKQTYALCGVAAVRWNSTLEGDTLGTTAQVI